MVYRKLLHLDVHTYGLCFKHFPPQGNKMMSSVWCPKWFYSQRLPYLSNVPLFVSYLLFSRDRGLSEAIATDFLFEAIQLVTCEVTFSFRLFVFFSSFSPTHLMSSLFLKAKFGLKKIFRKKKSLNNSPPPSKKTGTIWLFCTDWPNFGTALF